MIAILLIPLILISIIINYANNLKILFYWVENVNLLEFYYHSFSCGLQNANLHKGGHRKNLIGPSYLRTQ